MTDSETLRALIDQLKAEAREEAKTEIDALEQIEDAQIPGDYVEALAPDGARTLIAQIALIRFQKDALDKAEKQLVSAAKILVGEHTGIKAYGEPLAKRSVAPVTRVATEVIKAQFPPDAYPQYYTTTEQERLLIDTTFKRHVIEENSGEINTREEPRGLEQ